MPFPYMYRIHQYLGITETDVLTGIYGYDNT